MGQGSLWSLIMQAEFYDVKFFDKRDQKIHNHYVFTRNMRDAKEKIEKEEPYIKLVKWTKIDEDELPDLAVVIQK